MVVVFFRRFDVRIVEFMPGDLEKKGGAKQEGLVSLNRICPGLVEPNLAVRREEQQVC